MSIIVAAQNKAHHKIRSHKEKLSRGLRNDGTVVHRLTHSGFIVSNCGEKNVCIISPNSSKEYSETFIQAHCMYLPAKVRVLYQGWFPCYTDAELPLVPPLNPAQRFLRMCQRKIFKPRADIFQDRALRSFLQKNTIDVALAEFGPTGVHVCRTFQKAGIPLAVYFHGFDISRMDIIKRMHKHYAELFDVAAALIVGCQTARGQLLSLGAPATKIHIVPGGVNTLLFCDAQPANAPPHFVATGRFVEKKAPHLTLLAFELVKRGVPEATLTMIGDGPLLERCKTMAYSLLGLANAVVFTGALPQNEVAEHMRRARAFVQHSVTVTHGPAVGDSEGTAVTILEAGSSGLPVVSTRHAGIQESVIDGVTGFLVEEGDVRGMADHMIRLAQDPALANLMGKAARKRITDHYSVEICGRLLWDVLESIIQGQK